MQPTVIHTTSDYLIINKPAGLMVHGDGRSPEGTLADWVVQNYPHANGVGENIMIGDQQINRAGIVHRLDRDTSGVMIVALTQEFFDHIKQQFQEHQVQKTYHAYVYGHVKNDQGIIDAPIGRSSSDIRQWSATRGARGQLREAITEYQVLQRGSDGAGDPYTFIEFRPKTGRTHQIRVHAKYMNHPIVADEIYAGKLFKKDNLGFERQALHALRISFADTDGQQYTFQVPLPDDFICAASSLLPV